MGQKEIQICFTACILQVSMVNWSHIISLGKMFIKDGSYKMCPLGLWPYEELLPTYDEGPLSHPAASRCL